MQEMKSEGRHFANKDFVENLKKQQQEVLNG